MLGAPGPVSQLPGRILTFASESDRRVDSVGAERGPSPGGHGRRRRSRDHLLRKPAALGGGPLRQLAGVGRPPDQLDARGRRRDTGGQRPGRLPLAARPRRPLPTRAAHGTGRRHFIQNPLRGLGPARAEAGGRGARDLCLRRLCAAGRQWGNRSAGQEAAAAALAAGFAGGGAHPGPAGRQEMSVSTGSIKVERVDVDGAPALGLVTLNRPQEMNPLDWDTVRELGRALDGLAADDAVRLIAVTGAGRAFSAGGDMKKYRTLQRDAHDFPQFLADIHEVFARIPQYPKPVVALVNGIAVAGGIE